MEQKEELISIMKEMIEVIKEIAKRSLEFLTKVPGRNWIEREAREDMKAFKKDDLGVIVNLTMCPDNILKRKLKSMNIKVDGQFTNSSKIMNNNDVINATFITDSIKPEDKKVILDVFSAGKDTVNVKIITITFKKYDMTNLFEKDETVKITTNLDDNYESIMERKVTNKKLKSVLNAVNVINPRGSSDALCWAMINMFSDFKRPSQKKSKKIKRRMVINKKRKTSRHIFV